jgi:phage FluMu protein Com
MSNIMRIEMKCPYCTSIYGVQVRIDHLKKDPVIKVLSCQNCNKKMLVVSVNGTFERFFACELDQDIMFDGDQAGIVAHIAETAEACLHPPVEEEFEPEFENPDGRMSTESAAKETGSVITPQEFLAFKRNLKRLGSPGSPRLEEI